MAANVSEVKGQRSIQDFGECSFNDSVETWLETENNGQKSSQDIWKGRDSLLDDQNMPEHTPNKQTKLDYTTAARTSLHELTETGYFLDPNVENYSVDFESYSQTLENTTQCSDSGIECCSLANESNRITASQPSSSSNNAVGNLSIIDSQSHGNSLSSNCSKSTYADLFTQTNFPKNPYLHLQSSVSQRHNQSSIPTLNTQQTNKGNNHYHQFTSFDPLFDQGYSSNSTGSSNQGGQDSQREGSTMDQGSQPDLGTDEKDWPACNPSVDDNYLHGENELEDLLYHFKNFFQDRFESELHRYQEAVYGIIQEQQNHVRQIVHTAIREQSSSQRTNSNTDHLLSEDTEKIPIEAKSTIPTDLAYASMYDIDYYISPALPAAKSLSDSSTVAKEEPVKRLLDLYSLSCAVSTLLSKTQFKS